MTARQQHVDRADNISKALDRAADLIATANQEVALAEKLMAEEARQYKDGSAVYDLHTVRDIRGGLHLSQSSALLTARSWRGYANARRTL